MKFCKDEKQKDNSSVKLYLQIKNSVFDIQFVPQISSLRLSEAEKKILIIEDKNGTEAAAKISQMQQIPGAPNLFVIKVNEGEEYSMVSHRGGYSGVSSSQFASNSFEPSSDYQARRRTSNFSLLSRGIIQSSQIGCSTQLIDEMSELRLDQTNRFRENSFVPNNLMENDLPQLRHYLNNSNNTNNNTFPSHNNLNILEGNYEHPENAFEEQQNFKIYFAHNNLQNIISQPKTKSPLNQLKPMKQKIKQSSFIRVVSVNNKISNHQIISGSNNSNNQIDIISGLMPGNDSPFVQ